LLLGEIEGERLFWDVVGVHDFEGRTSREMKTFKDSDYLTLPCSIPINPFF
jgi:hypothetical protein